MRRIIILSVIILMTIQINAQKISGGLSFAPILSWVKSDSKTVEKDGNRLSVGYGLFIDYNFTDNFSFSSGINVNEVGGTIKYPETMYFDYENTRDTLPPSTKVFYKVRYIEIPISIKGKTNEIGFFTYFMKAGISPMFRWKARGDIYKIVDSKEIKIEDVNIKDEVSSFNLAFHVGAGFEYSLGGNTALISELLYYNGLTDITPDDKAKANNYTVVTHQFMLKVGIKF